jgi:hypothetical protein
MAGEIRTTFGSSEGIQPTRKAKKGKRCVAIVVTVATPSAKRTIQRQWGNLVHLSGSQPSLKGSSNAISSLVTVGAVTAKEPQPLLARDR